MPAFDPFLAMRPDESSGEYLTRIRKHSGVSAEAIADAGGISRMHLYRIEGKNHPYTPSTKLLEGYAKACGVPWLYLLKLFDYIDAEQFANAGFALSLLPERDKLMRAYRAFRQKQPPDVQAVLEALERSKGEWPLRIAIHITKYGADAAQEHVKEFVHFISEGREVTSGRRDWDNILAEIHAREAENPLLARLAHAYADIAALEGAMSLLPNGPGPLVEALRAQGLESDDISLTTDFVALLRKRRQDTKQPEGLS